MTETISCSVVKRDHLQKAEGRVSATYRKAVCLNLVRTFLEKFGI